MDYKNVTMEGPLYADMDKVNKQKRINLYSKKLEMLLKLPENQEPAK